MKAIAFVVVPYEELGKCLYAITDILPKMIENKQKEFLILWKLVVAEDEVSYVEDYITQKIIIPINKQISMVTNEERIREELNLPAGTLFHFFIGSQ